ncbi:MAG: two-component regulator propeller domain-containing protein [Acidobacteriota bacterium]|nr:two-component regulator propeller domain-containing protein [Acidobacteriota bacterium]
MFLSALVPVLLWAGQPHYLIRRTWNSASGLPHSSVSSIVQAGDGYLWVGTQQGLARFDGANFVLVPGADISGLTCSNIEALAMDDQGVIWVGTQTCGLFRMTAPFHFEKHPVPEIYISRLTWDDTNRHMWAVADDGRLYALKEETWERYSVTDFLDKGSSEVTTMQADHRDDSLWLATFDGLYHLTDPNTIRRIDLPGETTIHTVYQDHDGSIWAGGTHAYRIVAGKAERIPLENHQPFFKVSAFVRGEGLTVSVSQGGLYRLEGNRFTTLFPGDPDEAAEFSADLLYDREGNLWLGSMVRGLTRWRNGKVHFLRDFCREEVCHTWSVLRRANDEMWIGKDSRIDIYRNFELMPTPKPLADKLAESQRAVVTMAETREGHVLIATREAGAWRWDGKRIQQLILPGASPIIRGIVAARDGTIWIAPASGGLCRDRGYGFENVHERLGLKDDDLFSMIEDSRGRLWVGSLSGGVYRIGPTGTRQFLKEDGLSSQVISNFFEDRRGRIWVGSMSGIAVFDEDRFRPMMPEQGLPHETVVAFNQDASGRLWLSTAGSLAHADPDELAAFIRGEREDSGLVVLGSDESPHPYAGNVAGSGPAGLDPEGRVWFASERGAAVVDARIDPRNTVPIDINIERVIVNDVPLPAMPAKPDRKINRLEFHFNGACLTAGEKARFRFRLEGLDPHWREADENRKASYTSLPWGDYVFRVLAANNDGLWNEPGIAVPFRVPKPWWLAWWAWLGYISALTALIYGLLRWQARQAASREKMLEDLVAARTRGLIEAQEDLLESAHRAGIATHATEVLHNVGNTVNSINTSTSLIRETVEQAVWLQRMNRLLSLLEDPHHPFTKALAAQEKGDRFMEGLHRVSKGFQGQYRNIAGELKRISSGLAKIRGELLAQQKYDLPEETMTVVDLGELTEEVIASERNLMDTNNIHVKRILPRELWVRLERVRFKHVLLCLLTNACEARRGDSGNITVIAHRRHDAVLLSLRDDGKGIDPETLARVVHQGFSTKPGAAGMGLHFCANALQQIDGNLEVTSEGAGKGTEVRLIFPAVKV